MCFAHLTDALDRTIFLFRENPLPILCPITHILARAIRDDAIEVGGYTQAAPFFSTHIGKRAMKVQWKQSILKTPVFRRPIRAEDGGWVKSDTEPMRYSTYAFYLDRIGSDLGSEEKWTSYCMRRGNANAIIGVAPDAVVDQVMRHDPMTGCLANAYLNRRVGFNTQSSAVAAQDSGGVGHRGVGGQLSGLTTIKVLRGFGDLRSAFSVESFFDRIAYARPCYPHYLPVPYKRVFPHISSLTSTTKHSFNLVFIIPTDLCAFSYFQSYTAKMGFTFPDEYGYVSLIFNINANDHLPLLAFHFCPIQ